MKIKTLIIIYMFCYNATACVQEQSISGAANSLSLYGVIAENGNYVDSPSTGIVEACIYSATGSQSLLNISVAYGLNHILYAPPDFNVTLNVNHPATSGVMAEVVGIANYSDNMLLRKSITVDNGHGIADVVFSAANNARLYCWNAPTTAIGATVPVVGGYNFTVSFTKNGDSSLIHVTVNNTYIGNCTQPDDNIVYVPYIGTHLVNSGVTDFCMQLNSVYIKTNYTVANTFNFINEGSILNSIANCTAEFSQYFGQYPYFENIQISTDTNPTGLNRFYPSCNNLLGNSGGTWMNTGVIEAICIINNPPYTEYSSNGAYVYNTGSLQKNTAINISMFGENNTLCNLEVIIINETNEFIINANVYGKLLTDDIEVSFPLNTYGNGSYLLSNVICGDSTAISVSFPPNYPLKEYPYVFVNNQKMTIQLKASQTNYNFNIRVNATDYGTVNPQSIKAQVTSAINSITCVNQGGIPFAGYPYKKELNAAGNAFWGNLVTDKQWICAYLDFEDISRVCRKTEITPYILGQQDYNFTISCGFTPERKNQYVIQFMDSSTGNGIAGANYSIKSNGVTLYANQQTNNEGIFFMNESCNLNKLVYLYATDNIGFINANYDTEYNSITYNSCSDVSVKQIRLIRNPILPNSTNNFHWEGTLIDNSSNIIENVNILLKCSGQETVPYVNTNGTFNFTNIISGSGCYLTIGSLDWNGETSRINVNKDIHRNLTIYPVVVTPNTPVDQTFFTYVKMSTGNSPLSGVLVYISSGKQCTTINGKCNIPLFYGTSYLAIGTKDGYLTAKDSFIADGEDLPLILETPSGVDCTIEIQMNKLIGNDSAGIDGKITLTDSDGYIKSEEKTTNEGYLKLTVDCGNQYNIIGDINGYKVRKSIVTEEGEGHTQKITLEFDVSDIGFMQELKNYKTFVYSLFGFAFIITLLFLVLVVVMAIRAIWYGGNTNTNRRHND